MERIRYIAQNIFDEWSWVFFKFKPLCENPLQPVLVWNCSSQRLTKRLTDLLTHKSSSQTVLTLSLVFFWQSVWSNSSKVYYCILSRFVRHITFLLSSKPRELTFSPFLMITKPFSWKNFVNQKKILLLKITPPFCYHKKYQSTKIKLPLNQCTDY